MSDKNVDSHFNSAAWQVAAIALLLASTALASIDVLCGFWDHDSGALLLHSGYIAEGLRPYIDFSTHHPPLIQIIGSFGVLLGVDRLVLTIVLPLLWMIAITIATVVLLRAAGVDPFTSLLVGTIYPLFSIQNGGNHVANELPVAFFSCLAFIPLVRVGPLMPRGVAIATALASAAALSKQNGAVAFLPIVAVCAVNWRNLTVRHGLAFLFGSAALPLALAAWLSFDFGVIYTHLVERLAAYGSSSHFQGPTFAGEYRRAPETMLLFALGLVVGMILIFRGRDSRSRVLAATGVIGIVLQLVPRLLRNYPHYNLSVWPFLVLVLAVALRHSDLRLQFAQRLALAAIAISASMTSAFVPTWDSPGLLLSTYAPAAETLRRMTPIGTPVRQYGSEPIIEFLAHRREEIMKTPLRTHISWDGYGTYTGRPPKGIPVVVVDTQRPWSREVLADLRRWKYREAAAFGTHPRVSIFVEGE